MNIHFPHSCKDVERISAVQDTQLHCKPFSIRAPVILKLSTRGADRHPDINKNRQLRQTDKEKKTGQS